MFKSVLSQQGHQVYGTSLIDFIPKEYNLPKDFDYLFFSSKRGVRFFFEQLNSSDKRSLLFQKGLKIGAIGPVTASAVKAMGYACDFVGHSKDLNKTIAEFSSLAKGKKIVFPQAMYSQRSVQIGLDASVEIYDLVVYKNKPKIHFLIPEVDILVFTSPLNVKTYLNAKTIDPTQKIVVIGPTTAKAVKEAGYTNYYLSNAFDELSLTDVCH